MYPETVIALARMSEINRRLSDPVKTHRYQANRLHTAAQRARRRAFVARVRRVVETVPRGQRIGRPAAAA